MKGGVCEVFARYWIVRRLLQRPLRPRNRERVQVGECGNRHAGRLWMRCRRCRRRRGGSGGGILGCCLK